MIMKTFLLPIVLLLTGCCATAQTTYDEIATSPDKAAGLYYLYPVTKSVNTKVPKGYTPFYISHYGRHGSRYLVGEEQYADPLALFIDAEKAGVLTEKGKEVKRRLENICLDAAERSGELTPLGVEQHKGIARRMYEAFPEVFKGRPSISAKSSIRMRCALSMAAFCEALKEKDPGLEISKESALRYMKYISVSTPQAKEYAPEGARRSAEFESEIVQPERLMSVLFTDPGFTESRRRSSAWLMLNLFRIAVDAPNTPCPERLDDLFTPEERYKLWQYYNYHYYNEMSNPTSARGAVLENGRPLLANILESADAAIARGDNGADLRFGHDSTIVPPLGLLKVEGCYGSTDDPHKLHEVYADFKISPMAANLQIIFFRNKKGEVIAKLMLNEREVSLPVKTDIAPFYRWDDLRAYISDILAEKD